MTRLKLTAFLAAWACFALNFASAQIKGTVLNQDKRPIDGATVALLTAKDSALVRITLTNADGSFGFKNLKADSYRLKITFVGYQPYKSGVIIQNQQPVTLPAITLMANNTALKEVAVTTRRPMVEHLIDRTVVNVDQLISATGGTIMDALEKSPGVLVDQNDAISLQGKGGVKIYIDDKPTYLAGDDLANYLRSLPASDVDRIELMTNPSAKYDAAGMGGIINIRTKRIRELGFNGNLSLGYNQGKYGRTNNSLNLNYRYNKLNVAATIGYQNVNNFSDVTINRYFDPAVINNLAPNFGQTSFAKRGTDGLNSRLAIDYYATAQTTLGIGLTGLITNTNGHTLNTSRLSSTQSQLDSTILANNTDKRKFENGGINLNYRHTYDKKGTELTADADYIRYHTQIDQLFVNNSYLPNGALYYNQQETGNLPANISIYSFKTDYTHPLASGVKLSTGLKTSYTKTDNVADYFYQTSTAVTPDYGKTNHFIYSENINAAYINASKDWKRFSLQAGLRFENTIADGHQLGNVQQKDSIFSRNYNGLFPTFFAQYNLDSAGKQNINFEYGRRVERPDYNSLNPFLSPLDKFTYNQGNPFLLPAYTDHYELDYTYKNITTGISYAYTKDRWDGLVQIINGYYYNRPGNLGDTYVWDLEVDGTFDPAKWFNIHINTSLMEQRTVTNFYTGPLNVRGFRYRINPVLTFRPGKDWVIQTDGNYQTGITTEQFIDAPRGQANIGLSKKLSASTSIRLAANDIFNTMNKSWQIGHLVGTQANYRAVADTHNILVSLSYRFGKTINNLRKHNANGAQSEQNRVGN